MAYARRSWTEGYVIFGFNCGGSCDDQIGFGHNMVVTVTTAPLLLRHWYEIMALYYVKSILTEISAFRQDRRVLQKNQNHQNRISEQMGHATDF